MRQFLLVSVFMFSTGAVAQWDIQSVVERLNDICAGNGTGSSITSFDPSQLDVSRAMGELKKRWDSSCKRIYSKSKSDGARKIMAYLESPDSCAYEFLSRYEMHVLKTVVEDPTNLAVLANLHDPVLEEHSEACSTWYFQIYRQNGQLIDLEFDHTD